MSARTSRARLATRAAVRAAAALVVVLALLPGAPLLRAAVSLRPARLCAMPCCAGKAPHEAGSCPHAFAGHKHEETHAHASHSHDAHGGAHETPRAKGHGASAASVGRPCDPECRAGAVTTAQRRPAGDGAVTSPFASPRAPASAPAARQAADTNSPRSEWRRRQTRPRAPPSSHSSSQS